MKFRFVKILLYSVSVIVVLLFSLYGILRSSVVQTYLTQYIVAYLSEELNTTVRVGGVDIELFNTVVLEDVYLEDLHDDTLLYANRLKINIEDIDFGGHQLILDKIVLENTSFNLKKYKSEDHLNLQFIIDALRSDDTLRSEWGMSCNTVELINSDFSYRNEHKPLIKWGFNYHDINASHINVRIGDIRIKSDTIWGDIENLSCIEKSGFILKEFAANVKSTPVGLYLDGLTIKTPLSNIKTQLSFQYAAYRDFLEFIDKVRIRSDFDKSEVAFDDIAYFVPGLHGLTEKITLSGLVKGKVSRLKGKNIDIAFGRSSRFYGSFSLTGLPNIRETFIHLKVKELRTRHSDLKRLHIPPFTENKHLKIPEIIASLGNIKFRGEFTGFYNDFVAYGDFFTDIGQFSSDVSLKEDALAGKVKYSGSLASNDFDAGIFLSLTDHLGKTGFNVHIDGSGFTKDDVEAHLKGVIRNIEFNGYNYRNVEVEGDLADRRFNGLVSVNDENIDLDFNGKVDFTKAPPVFDFRATIGNANLTALNFEKRDTVSYLSATMIYNLSGDDIDNMEGKLNINNIIYQLGEEVSGLGDLKLIASEREGIRYLQLNSDFADAEIKGSFRMEYLMGSFNKLLQNLLPSNSIVRFSNSKNNTLQNFEFSLHLKNTEILSRLFLPELRLSSNSHFSGTYDDASNRLVLKGRSPEIELYGRKITQWYIDAQTENNRDLSADKMTDGQLIFYLNTGCSRMSITDSIWVENFNVQTRTGNDSILFGIGWENDGPPAGRVSKQVNRGDVNGYIAFKAGGETVFSFLPSEIVIVDSIWTINSGNRIIFDSTSISIIGFAISNNAQQIKIEGSASRKTPGGINVLLSNIQLANLNPITHKYKFDLKGTVNGNTTISNIYSDPVLSGNIDIVDLELNKSKLGNATIVSNWDNNRKTVQILATVTRGQLKTIEVIGEYNLSRKDDPIDFDINLQKLKMHLFEPFIEGVFSNIRGVASGHLILKGNLSEPVLTGRIKLQKIGFLIDYINTRYSFASDINFYENRIGFNNLTLNDSKGNRAVVNGNIYHDYLKDFKLDIKVDAENLYCLNTTIVQNDLYYGEVYATGQIDIKGGISARGGSASGGNDIVIDISAKAQKGSRIFIPLTETEVVSENSFITFVSSTLDTITSKKKETNISYTRKGLGGINLDIEITPDAEIQLIFDEKVGDILKSRGNGNLKITIDNSGDFSMFGVFVIEEGEYLFTLQNIINKRFNIEKGGNIRWNGDPYDADIDLNAIYPLKASLYGLTLDSADRRRIPVECELQMTGQLLTPEINFDIKLPNADEGTRSSVNSLITTEQQMNKQIFSLLILGSFQPASNTSAGSGFDAGGGVGVNTSEVLSNQLSNWLSQISEDFDIGVNYRPGDDITDKEVELALSTQLFDDRLTINGSVANNPNASNTNTSSIVGDFNLDYKITEDGKLRIKAFNRSNDYILTTDNTPYKQGVGIFYRKEFNNFWDLFKRRKRISP